MLKSLVNVPTRKVFTCLFTPASVRVSKHSLLDAAATSGCSGSINIVRGYKKGITEQKIPKKRLNQEESAYMEEPSGIESLLQSTDQVDEAIGFAFPDINTPNLKVDGELYKDMHIVHIATVRSNVIMALTRADGQTVTTTSGGAQGFRNKRESTGPAAHLAAIAIAKKAKELNIKNIRVCLKGFGLGREAGVKALQFYGMNIVSLTDTSHNPFGGDRPPAVRRL